MVVITMDLDTYHNTFEKHMVSGSIPSGTVKFMEKVASATFTSSSSTATCTGSRDECKHKKSNSQAVTIGVSVGIPVGVVVIVMCIILYFVHKRSKKEDLDRDPEFEGDIAYLADTRPRGYTFNSSDESSEFKEKGNVVSNPFNDNVYTANLKSVDVIQLPTGLEKKSIRAFVEEQSDSTYGAWKNASVADRKFTVGSQKNNSSTSISSKSVNNTTSVNGRPKFQVKNVTNGSRHNEQEFGVSPHKENTKDTQLPIIKVIREETEDIGLTSKEEENIRRIKSIYKIYLEDGESNRLSGLPENIDNVTFNEISKLTGINDSTTSLSSGDFFMRDVVLPNTESESTVNTSISDSSITRIKSHKASANFLNTHITSDGKDAKSLSEIRSRIASSVYSEIPVLPMHLESQQYSIENGVADSSNQMQFPVTNYNLPVFNQPNYTGIYPQYGPQQYKHPQTMEDYEELPTPFKLSNSDSIQSLTAYKNRPKYHPLAPLKTVNLFDSALNPMDHPDLFYTQTIDSSNSFQEQGSTYSDLSKASVPVPSQLRQSIVMTDPSVLTIASRYKPAGSFRKVQNMNSRNNSLVSQVHPLQAAFNSRVSGLLDNFDVLQPRSVGKILPHSGSNDDLRKQLGTSNNYQISS